jgi:hypothetical protein
MNVLIKLDITFMYISINALRNAQAALQKSLLTGKLIRNRLQRLSLHSSCPFMPFILTVVKKHIHNIICLLPISRLLAVGSFVSLNGVRIRFSVFTWPFLSLHS